MQQTSYATPRNLICNKSHNATNVISDTPRNLICDISHNETNVICDTPRNLICDKSHNATKVICDTPRNLLCDESHNATNVICDIIILRSTPSPLPSQTNKRHMRPTSYGEKLHTVCEYHYKATNVICDKTNIVIETGFKELKINTSNTTVTYGVIQEFFYQ